MPLTTYVPETNYYVGVIFENILICSYETIQKLKRKTTQAAKVTGTRKNGIAKETSEKKKFHSTPIPLSTFIRPSTSADDLRKLYRHQRAIELLTSASEPFGLEVNYYLLLALFHNITNSDKVVSNFAIF